MKSPFKLSLIKMTLLFSLSLGFILYSCSKSKTATIPTVKTNLQLAIDSAKFYLNTTVEGTKPGEYTVGSKATLTTALNSATTILNDGSSSQATLDNATANLNAAIAAYKTNFIQQIAAANLIAFWKFNGNANDSSGNKHDGVVTMGNAYFGGGTPSLTADRFGNAGLAYHFDKGGNIEVPYSPALNPQQMSISLWERQDTAGRTVNPSNCYMIAMNRWNGWKFQTQPFLPFFTVNTDSSIYDRDDAGIAVVPGTKWYHLVVTYKPGEEDFYINGSLVKSWTNVPGAPKTLTAPINITIGSDLPTSVYTATDDGTGRFFVNYGGFWTGDLDDVMFYNIALTAPQVQSVFNNQNTQ